MLCLAFGPDNTTYAGTLNGDVYVWKGNKLDRALQAVHKVYNYVNEPAIRKSVFGGLNQVRLNRACSATETS